MSDERAHVIDWEHLGFLLVILAFLVWYIGETTVASPTFSNLILIAPVGACAVGLAIAIGAMELFGRAATTSAARPDPGAADAKEPSRFRSGSVKVILPMMALFGVFVAVIPYLGFDIASFSFVAATLWLLGERRVLVMLALALGISVAISIAALTLLTVPVPMDVAPALWSAL